MYLTCRAGLTTEEFLSPRNWASALQKTMEGERQHLSPHIGDFNDDSKTKISQNGLSEILYKEQAIQIICKSLKDLSFVLLNSTLSTHLYSQSLTTLVQWMNEMFVSLAYFTRSLFFMTQSDWIKQCFEKNLMTNGFFQNLPYDKKNVYKPSVVFVVIREI